MVGTTRKIKADADTEYTLPPVDGNATQVLSTNGSGTLSWATAGGTSGGTGKNYIDNGTGEDDTSGWITYFDSAGLNAVNGIDGSPTVTLTRNTSTPLSGSGDLLITKDGSNRQGEGSSYAFTIDNADKAKKLVVSFDYTTSANYADDDIKIQLYDISNTTLISPNGEDLKAVSGTGKHYASFQTASDSTSYRLIFHCSSTNANAYTVNMDSVQVGAQTISHGTPATEWESYTPTLNSETNVSAKYAQYKRVGDSIEVKFAVKYSGQGATSGWTLSLPSGLTFDTAKMPQVAEADGVGFLGSCAWYNAGQGTSDLQVAYSTTTAVHIFGDIREIAGAGDGDGTGDESTNFLQSNYLYTNDYLSGTFTAPISGWSSNTQMSEDFSGRDVVCISNGMSGTFSVTNSLDTLITTWDNYTDTTGSFNGTYYTAPEAGYYDINYNLQIQADGDTDITAVGTKIFKDIGSGNVMLLQRQVQTNAEASQSCAISQIVNLNKGDKISFWLRQTNTDSDAMTFSGTGDEESFFSISKRSSPQTILENETVACRIRASASVSMNLTSATQLTFNTTDFDTHGGFSDGNDEYTIPVTGYYSVNAHLDITSGTDAEQCLLTLRKDDAVIMQKRTIFQAQYAQAEISDIYYFAKGDTVQLYGQVTSDTAVVVQEAYAVTSFSIAKIK